MSSEPNHQSHAPDSDVESARPPEAPDAASEVPPEGEAKPAEAPASSPSPHGPEAEPVDPDAEAPANTRTRRRRILIGSQRDPAAYRPGPRRDWIPLEEQQEKPAPKAPKRAEDRAVPEAAGGEKPPAGIAAGEQSPPQPPADPQAVPPKDAAVEAEPAPPAAPAVLEEDAFQAETAASDLFAEMVEMPAVGESKRFPPPNIRGELPPDLEDQFQAAIAGAPLDELMTGGEAVTGQSPWEAESTLTGRVVAVRREDVFVELGDREQGILPVKQFDDPPEVGSTIEVRVVRFNPEDGLYELALPQAAAEVGDWSDLEEGMIVEARVRGHNSGGLECEVNHIRGFIPVSQIALYRVEDLAEFVDQKFNCLVTEVNPRRRNLVLSRRAVLEREREEARQQLLESLAPGQVREGVVRKLVDFGAFIDLGGVDGLLHVSQLSWARVDHPSDVLQEGQKIEVRVEKVDASAGRISLAYRDMLENPWTDVDKKYPPNTTVEGKVSKLMEFGAFVELEPGVEGLVHISELSHKRVWRPSDVVNEGDQIQAVVLSVDAEAQRISLSIKDLTPEPEPAAEEEPGGADKPPPPPKRPRKPSTPLKGGLGRSPRGEQFGLKW